MKMNKKNVNLYGIFGITLLSSASIYNYINAKYNWSLSQAIVLIALGGAVYAWNKYGKVSVIKWKTK